MGAKSARRKNNGLGPKEALGSCFPLFLQAAGDPGAKASRGITPAGPGPDPGVETPGRRGGQAPPALVPRISGKTERGLRSEGEGRTAGSFERGRGERASWAPGLPPGRFPTAWAAALGRTAPHSAQGRVTRVPL